MILYQWLESQTIRGHRIALGEAVQSLFREL